MLKPVKKVIEKSTCPKCIQVIYKGVDYCLMKCAKGILKTKKEKIKWISECFW